MSTQQLLDNHLRLLVAIRSRRAVTSDLGTSAARLRRSLLARDLTNELHCRRQLADRLAEALVRNDFGTADLIYSHLRIHRAAQEPQEGGSGGFGGGLHVPARQSLIRAFLPPDGALR